MAFETLGSETTQDNISDRTVRKLILTTNCNPLGNVVNKNADSDGHAQLRRFLGRRGLVEYTKRVAGEREKRDGEKPNNTSKGSDWFDLYAGRPKR